MPEKRVLTCIICPVGCRLEACLEKNKEIKVSGNNCSRGISYAQNELTNPLRTLTSTVRINGGEIKLLPVKSKSEVSKHLLKDMMLIINQVSVDAPVELGQVIIPNILESGVDIISTRPVNKTM